MTGTRTSAADVTDKLIAATDGETVEVIDVSSADQPTRFGRYEVLGQLGAGGMGIVLEARDPTLDRKVALKLLRPRRNRTLNATARRLATEAQAMARLAHPNVVTVFEIDRVADQVYVAMELVAGTTLRGWLHERPRRWPEIVELFIAAGRGLAAAHAGGLVHRDFKPDNVLIGNDGRPRVCDFGLVVDAGDDAEPPAPAARESDTASHETGVGTPAYMSPEQWTGQAVDARSDQFAFCVALWEALYKQRPFAGQQLYEIRTAVASGVISEPATGRRVPRWLLAMVRRGLAVDPAARWPDMTALLDALDRRTRTGWRWTIGLAAGLAVASAAAAVVVVGTRDAPDPCAAPGARLAAVWGPARGGAVRAHLAAVDPALGNERYTLIASAFDVAARSWSTMHVAACRATRIDGRQSDMLLDRRMECLDRWLVELADTVDVVALARTPQAVDQSLRAATSLSSLEACADVRTLAQAPPLVSPADRAAAIALANLTRELDVAQRAGRLDGLPAKADELVTAARALGHAPTLAGALAVQAKTLYASGSRGATEPILRELIQLAAHVHDDRTEAYAWITLVATLASAKGKLDDALALVPSARAAVARAGDPVDLQVDLLFQHAAVLDGGRRAPEGLALLTQARQLLEQAGATSASSPLARRLTAVLRETGASHARVGDYDAAIASYAESRARARAVSGVDSTDEANGWHNLAATLQHAGKLDDALAAEAQAVRIYETRLGDSFSLALSLTEQASVLSDQGRWAESLATYDRALPMSRAALAPGDVNLGTPLIGRGVALYESYRLDEAARDLDEAIAVFEHAGGKTVNLAIAVLDRGDVAERAGQCGDAIGHYSRAIGLLDEITGPTSHLLIYPLSGKAACLVNHGRAGEAIALLERALACKSDGEDVYELARVRSYLGRALVETRHDVAGGFAMVRAARPGIAASPKGTGDLRLLDRWLATHRR